MTRLPFPAGQIPRGTQFLLRALLLLGIPWNVPAAAQETFFVLTPSGELRRFQGDSTGTINATLTITGMHPGELPVGIDMRPADGQIYAVGDLSRLYRINRTTGVATEISTAPFAVLLNGTSFGVDFNPSVDRIRIVSDAQQNIRVNPNNGTLSGQDASLSVGGIVATAYSNNTAGATPTTVYGIDAASDMLVRIGGVGGSPSANGGVVTTLGPLGVDAPNTLGFDIAADGTAYVAMAVAGSPQLRTVNLDTGASLLVGNIGGSGQIAGLTVALPPTLSVADIAAAEGDEGSTELLITVSLSWTAYYPISVDYQTVDGSALAGEDYTAASGTLTFAAGEMSRTVAIALSGDRVVEPDETFTLALANSVKALISDTEGVATLTSDDPDADGDGTADSLDGCPDDPAKTAPGCSACGEVDPDADGDGHGDCQDNCPSAANADQADSDGDGTGDACDGSVNGGTCGVGTCGAGASLAMTLTLLAALRSRRNPPSPRGRLRVTDKGARRG